MTSLTRGPLPAQVYWRRRVAVIASVVLVIIVLARMLSGGDGEGTSSAKAQQAAGTTASSTPSADVSASPSVGAPGASSPAAPSTSAAPGAASSAVPGASASPASPGGTAGATAGATVVPLPTTATTPTASTPPPAPEGACEPSDVSVVPGVKRAVAGDPVYLQLTLRTLSSPACTWQVSADTMQVKVSSGTDRVWSTIDCPAYLTQRTLVLRNDAPVAIAVKWNARRSDSDCSRHTPWAQRGYYHLVASVLGGEPADAQFQLR